MKAELLSYWGNDNMTVDVARVSYGKEASNYSDEQNQKLINYLVKHKHTSPFRHPQLQFRVKCPIYVERQLFKHQIGISVNSISGRYVDFSDSYTTVTEWRKQSTSSKQGSEGLIVDQDIASTIEHEVIEFCKERYEELIKLGIAKEQARSILPLNLNTEFIWSGSFLAFIHMCDLRLKPDAQQETQTVVNMMLQEVKRIEGNPFQFSLKAFGYGE